MRDSILKQFALTQKKPLTSVDNISLGNRGPIRVPSGANSNSYFEAAADADRIGSDPICSG